MCRSRPSRFSDRERLVPADGYVGMFADLPLPTFEDWTSPIFVAPREPQESPLVEESPPARPRE